MSVCLLLLLLLTILLLYMCARCGCFHSAADYYPPLRAYNFTVTGEEVTPGAFSQKLPVTDSAFLYRSAIQLTWNYQYAQFDKTATPDNKPVHACWCWDSCAIKHNITVYVIVDGRVVSTLVLVRLSDFRILPLSLPQGINLQPQKKKKILINISPLGHYQDQDYLHMKGWALWEASEDAYGKLQWTDPALQIVPV